MFAVFGKSLKHEQVKKGATREWLHSFLWTHQADFRFLMTSSQPKYYVPATVENGACIKVSFIELPRIGKALCDDGHARRFYRHNFSNLFIAERDNIKCGA